MSIEEFKAKIKEIDEEAEHKKRVLIKQYCFENARFKVGDVVEDHIGKVQVEKILSFMSFSEPCPVYRGRTLRKDGTPTKKVETRDVYQSNVKP